MDMETHDYCGGDVFLSGGGDVRNSFASAGGSIFALFGRDESSSSLRSQSLSSDAAIFVAPSFPVSRFCLRSLARRFLNHTYKRTQSDRHNRGRLDSLAEEIGSALTLQWRFVEDLPGCPGTPGAYMGVSCSYVERLRYMSETFF